MIVFTFTTNIKIVQCVHHRLYFGPEGKFFIYLLLQELGATKLGLARQYARVQSNYSWLSYSYRFDISSLLPLLLPSISLSHFCSRFSFSSLTPFFFLFFLRPQSIALTFYLLLYQTSVRRVIHLNGFLFEVYVSS